MERNEDSLAAEQTVYFRDGQRKIDAIIVYTTSKETPQINNFLNTVKQMKLHYELEASSSKEDDKTYVKIHAPHDVLLKNAVKFDIAVKFKQITKIPEPPMAFNLNCMKTVLNHPAPDLEAAFTARAWDTLSKEMPKTFSNAERSAIVFKMLDYLKYDADVFAVGLSRLIHEKVFIDAYPLHDGKWEWPPENSPFLNDRQLLVKYWGNFKMWNKQQPLSVVVQYLGHEIGLYFGWLGFYNWMLIIASIMGCLTFFMGLLTVFVIVPAPITEACSSNLTLCPYCKLCETEQLLDFCFYFRYAYLNDNFSSVVFACAMSYWATFFMEFWKREQAILMARWNVSYIEDLTDRPEFVFKASDVRYHKYTNQLELFIPATSQILHCTISIIVVSFMVLTVLIVIFCIVIYECWLKTLAVEKLYITFTSAMMTVVLMVVLRKVYGGVAIWLTKQETPRTQLDFDKSYVMKMIIFSLVNSYGKLAYIAFFKGKFFTYPGDAKVRNSKFPLMAEVCDPTGCVSEVSMLLATVTIFKPIFENCLEVLAPILQVLRRRLKQKNKNVTLPIWEMDFDLNQTDRFFIMEEVEEMVMQYGFVTLLVPAFPLAPVAALINNICEIRIDSSKILKYYRRPTGKNSTSIYLWFDTLQAMTYLAVVTNGLFITFTSQFIPQMVYYFKVDKNLKGFSSFLLSHFKVVDDYWQNANITECWYVGQRYPPDHENEYKKTYMYFYIMSWRLGFTIGFTLTVLLTTGIIAYIIPDIPRGIRDLISYNKRKARDVQDK